MTHTIVENKNSFILFLILTYPLLWVWQGLDFLDHGYWVAAYQQFISYPKGIGNAAMASWGTLAIGYIWQQLFGSLGFISFKLGYVVVILVTFFITYYALKDVFSKNRTIFLFAIFVTFLFITKKTGIIDYNNLTALFYLLGGVLIFVALKKQYKFLILFAGLVLGFNIFIRLPNILGILLITAVWLHAYVKKWNIRKIVNFSIIFIAGYILAIISILLLMLYIGHLDYYLNGLKGIFEIANTIGSHHSSSILLWLLLRDYSLALFSGVVCIFASIFFTKKITYLSAHIKWLIILALALVSYPILGFNHIGDWLIPGIIYIILLISLFFQIKSNDKLASLTYIALAILALAPLGSDNGMWNAIFGMWLALPLTLMTVYKLKNISWGGFHIKNIEIKTIYQTFITVVFIYSLITIFTSTYHDSANRFKMTYSVEHPLLKNVFTTEERIVVVQELLDELTKYVKPNDYLLAYNKIPMIYYLTNTRPWLGDSWSLSLSKKKLKVLIDAISKKDNLPIIVRALGDTSNRGWPEVNNGIEDNYLAPEESRKLLDEFILEQNYNSVWENKFFEILSSG